MSLRRGRGVRLDAIWNWRGRIAADHGRTEVRELADGHGRARAVWQDAALPECERERHRDVEFLQRAHLPVEPVERIREETLGPAEARAHMFHAEASQPHHGFVQTMILEVEPLAYAQSRRPAGERLGGELGRSILSKQPHGV